MRTKIIIFFLLISFPLIAFSPEDGNKERDKVHMAFTQAFFDVLQQDELSLEGRVELRYDKADWVLDPFAGIMMNIDGAKHLYAGFNFNVNIIGGFYINPSFAPGIYYNNKSKNLHFLLEFRSQLELAYRFENDFQMAISFNHISNASLGELNPGVESIAITYLFPLSR